MKITTFATWIGIMGISGAAVAADLGDLKNALGKESGNETTKTETTSAASGLLGGLAGGLSLPSIGSGTASNAAGVLQYCVKHKYLDGDAASAIKDKLLGSAGIEPADAEQDEGYATGLGGLLKGSDGGSLSLDSISDSVKDKACDYVLDNATSLVP